jgi:hypothetical protein
MYRQTKPVRHFSFVERTVVHWHCYNTLQEESEERSSTSVSDAASRAFNPAACPL